MSGHRAIELLKKLIAAPSFSRDEAATADILEAELQSRGIDTRRYKNNVWAVADNFDSSKPVLLLNSHHDTVRPAAGWTRDPFHPEVENGRLYGLGSNDAGASGVSLIEAFDHYRKSSDLSLNLILAITAEEEVSGENGMRSFLPMLKEEGYKVDMALVGEPTCMQPAIAERGLVVLDCEAKGVAGHAARGDGKNAIYEAIADVEVLKNLTFPKVSEELGPIHIAVTQIEAGTQHNVIPASCKFVVDVRTTDAYTNEQTVEIIREAISSEANPRSTRIRASALSRRHPMTLAAEALGGVPFSSPTTSDMALMNDFPSLKMGPGNSSRSHKADEYIELEEINAGVDGYIKFIQQLAKHY